MTDPTPFEAARLRVEARRALPERVRREQEDRAAVLVMLYSIETGVPIDGDDTRADS